MSRLRRLLALAGLLSVGTFACQLLVGIGEEPFLVSDAAAPAMDASAGEAAADPCDHAEPPKRVDADDRGSKNTYFVALSSLGLQTADGGPDPEGYDLDGTCTCDERPGAREGGAPSCTIPSTATSKLCDPGNRGIDNELGVAATRLVDQARMLGLNVDLTNAFTQQYADEAQCGKRAVILAITGYNGERDDFLVGASLLDSYGIRSPQDGGARSPIEAGCGNSDDGPPFPAKYDGTDGWSLPKNIVLDRELRNAVEAWVTNYTLVVDSRRQSLSQRLTLGGLDVERSGSVLVAKLIPLDERGAKLPLDASGSVASGKVAGFTVESGVVAGRAPIQPLLKSLTSVAIPIAGMQVRLCDVPALAQFPRDTVCPLRDIRSVPTRDFAGDACDAVSFAIRFQGKPALVTSDTHDLDAGASSCALPESAYTCE